MEPELSISFGAAHHSCRDGDDRTREGDKVTEFQAHRDCVSSCQFCYRDSVIVTASHDATLSLWVSSYHRVLASQTYFTNLHAVAWLYGVPVCIYGCKYSILRVHGLYIYSDYIFILYSLLVRINYLI